MKTWSKFIFMAIVAIFGILVGTTSCDNGSNEVETNLWEKIRNTAWKMTITEEWWREDGYIDIPVEYTIGFYAPYNGIYSDVSISDAIE
jgi:hypothetical protein